MSELDPSKLDKLKVAELQEELKLRGLDSKGKKAALVSRLKKALIASDGDKEEDFSISINEGDTSQELDESSQEASFTEEQSEPVVEQPAVAEATPIEEFTPEEAPLEEESAPVEEQQFEAEPVQEEQPEPVQEEQPEPVQEPVQEEQQEPVQEEQPEPVQYEEPEPVQETEPMSVAEDEPIPQIDAVPEEIAPKTEEQAEEMQVTEPAVATEQAQETEAPVQNTGDDATTEDKENMDIKEKKVEEGDKVNGEQMDESKADVKTEELDSSKDESKQERGEKRRRSRSRSPRRSRSRSPRDRRKSGGREGRDRDRDRSRQEPPKPRRRPRSPIEPEDDSWKEWTHVILDKYNSDLSLRTHKDGLFAKPWSDEGFAMVWAGARASFGVKAGKVAFEVKLVENLDVSHMGTEEVNPNVLRVGWSTDDNNLLLGEEELSFGYGGTAKSSTDLKFKDYGETFTAADVITAYVDLDSDPCIISYAKNGQDLGQCFEFEKEKLGDKALFPHILTKNTTFECNFGAKEEPHFPLKEEYVFIGAVPVEERFKGSQQAEKREDCEMIMMVGLPACGKSTWVEKYHQEHPEAKFNVLGTNSIIDKMKVMGLPRKKNYAGRWDVLIDKATKCLNRMMDIASKRKRNYILDQTNVYASARRRKMQPFEGFARRAVVVVPEEEEYKTRLEKQQNVDGKEVPEKAIYEMKANFTVPDVGMLFDEVDFPELQRDEAEKLVEQYREEGQKNLPPPAPSPPPEKKFRDEDDRDSRRDYRRRDGSREGGSRWSDGGSRDRQNDRYGGGGRGGGNRWGGGGGGRGGRWGDGETMTEVAMVVVAVIVQVVARMIRARTNTETTVGVLAKKGTTVVEEERVHGEVILEVVTVEAMIITRLIRTLTLANRDTINQDRCRTTRLLPVTILAGDNRLVSRGGANRLDNKDGVDNSKHGVHREDMASGQQHMELRRHSRRRPALMQLKPLNNRPIMQHGELIIRDNGQTGTNSLDNNTSNGTVSRHTVNSRPPDLQLAQHLLQPLHPHSHSSRYSYSTRLS